MFFVTDVGSYSRVLKIAIYALEQNAAHSQVQKIDQIAQTQLLERVHFF